MNSLRLRLLVLGLCGLAGCATATSSHGGRPANPDGRAPVRGETNAWVTYRGNEARTGTFDTKPLRERPREMWRFRAEDWVNSSPSVSNGIIYFGSWDWNLYAARADAGWEPVTLSTDGFTVDASTGWKVESSTAGLVWKFKCGEWFQKPEMQKFLDPNQPQDAVVYSSVALADGVAYFGSNDTYVRALNAATGKVIWEVKIAGKVKSSPALVGSWVVIGCDDGNLYALDRKTGREAWKIPVGGKLYSSPAVAGRRVYVTGYETGRVFAGDLDKHVEAWHVDIGDKVSVTPAVGQGLVFAGNWRGEFVALDAATGMQKWRIQPSTGPVHGSPAYWDGKVAWGSKDFSVYCADAATGKMLWTYKTGSKIKSAPVVVDGVLYVGSEDFHLYALDAGSGKVLWRCKTNESPLGCATVLNGVVYFGSLDHHLYALR